MPSNRSGISGALSARTRIGLGLALQRSCQCFGRRQSDQATAGESHLVELSLVDQPPHLHCAYAEHRGNSLDRQHDELRRWFGIDREIPIVE